MTIALRSDVLFRFAKSNLTPAARKVLASVGATVKARATGTVKVTGYTDGIGSDAVNLPLSQARARAVVGALAAATAGASLSLQAGGQGSSNPVAPNTNPDGSDNPAGRALNRRVEITFAAKTRAPPTPPPAATPAAPVPASTARTVQYRAGTGSTASGYQVTVDRAFREGNLLVLGLTVACMSPTPQLSSCDSQFAFAGTRTAPPISLLTATGVNSDLIYQTANTIGAVYLRDPATGTLYIPAHTFLSPVSANVQQLQVGYSYPVWAYYPAPPASVQSISVLLPGGSPRVDQVPIAPSASAP